MPLGLVGSDLGLGRWASWAVHGLVHGVVHGLLHMCMGLVRLDWGLGVVWMAKVGSWMVGYHVHDTAAVVNQFVETTRKESFTSQFENWTLSLVCRCLSKTFSVQKSARFSALKFAVVFPALHTETVFFFSAVSTPLFTVLCPRTFGRVSFQTFDFVVGLVLTLILFFTKHLCALGSW